MNKALKLDRALYACFVELYYDSSDKGYIEFHIQRDGKSEKFGISLKEWKEIVAFVEEQVTQHEEEDV